MIVAKQKTRRARPSRDLAHEVTVVSASLPSLAARTPAAHPRELTRPDTYGSSLRSNVRMSALSPIARSHAHVFTPAALPLPLGQYCCATATAASISRAGALLAGPDYPAANTPPTSGALPSQRRLPPALTALSATGAAAARVARSRADGDEVRCAAAGTRAIAGAHRPNDPWLVRTRAYSRGVRSVTPRAQRAARLHTLVLSRLAAPRSGVRVGRAAPARAPTAAS